MQSVPQRDGACFRIIWPAIGNQKQPIFSNPAKHFENADVHFDFDSPALSDAASSILAINADWLVKYPTVKVEIEGHCDERGTEEYNLALGEKRAKAVSDTMVKLGVDASRMRTISYGESVPLDPGHTEEAWAKNRRAHFAIVR